jgi:hypoxanthine phosphoribosyltransferase
MDGDARKDSVESIGPIILDAETIRRRVGELGLQVSADYEGRRPHLVAVLKGASIFHADLLRSIPIDVTVDHIAVASYGSGTRSSGDVRILKELDDSVENRDVLLVEDILDTGLTLNYLLRNLASRSPRSLKVITLLKKLCPGAIPVPVDYVGFEIPDEFVVGYGLDCDQSYRNLPDIHILKIREQSP